MFVFRPLLAACCLLLARKGVELPSLLGSEEVSHAFGAARTREGRDVDISEVKTWVGCRALLDSAGVGELRLVDAPIPRGEKKKRGGGPAGVGKARGGRGTFVFLRLHHGRSAVEQVVCMYFFRERASSVLLLRLETPSALWRAPS